MSLPKLTIITPVYNSEKYLKEYFENILLINYQNLEIIIVDGRSKDDSLKIINSYKNQLNLKVISEDDHGIYDAMNKGIKISMGDYIYFMGADDFLYNNDIFKKLLSDKTILEYDFIYGNFCFKFSKKIRGGMRNQEDILLHNICHQAIIYKKTIFNKIGFYNLKYKICADYDLNIRCFYSNQIKIKYINEVIGTFDSTGTSSNGCDKEFIKFHKQIIIQKLGYFYYIKYNIYQFLLKTLKKLKIIE